MVVDSLLVDGGSSTSEAACWAVFVESRLEGLVSSCAQFCSCRRASDSDMVSFLCFLGLGFVFELVDDVSLDRHALFDAETNLLRTDSLDVVDVESGSCSGSDLIVVWLLAGPCMG